MKRVVAGARIRHLREERGLSQAQLARQLEISPSYLNQIERDRRPLTVAVLLRITETFGVDPGFFSGQDTARLIAELREALGDEAIDVKISSAETAELATNMPSIARALIALRRRHRDTIEHTTALLEGREDGREDGREYPPIAQMPHEEARDFFYDRQNYIETLDRAAEQLAQTFEPGVDIRNALMRRLRDNHDVRVSGRQAPAETSELRSFDPDARVLRIAPQLRPGQQAFQMAMQVALLEQAELIDQLTGEVSFVSREGHLLTRIGLANYFAAATLMPYEVFHTRAEQARYDVELLAEEFRVGFETVCHRLSTLQRPTLRGVPFSFVRVDRAGNVSKRASATGFHFSRGGGTCPLWTVYEAFQAPGQMQRQIASMPDGGTFLWIARTVGRKRVGFGTPTKTFALGLGCELRHAHRLVYSDGLALDDRSAMTPIGMGCKTCDRSDCPQRAFPPVHREFVVDENRSTFEAYPAP